MKAKAYSISLSDNRQCDNCQGEVSIQRITADFGGWEVVSSPSFGVQTNLEFLKKFRRWCCRCNKPSQIKYQVLTKKEL
jgi:hypothetical protein